MGDGQGIREDLDLATDGVGGRAGKGDGTGDEDIGVIYGVTRYQSVVLALGDDLVGGTGQRLSVVVFGGATRDDVDLSGHDLQHAFHVGDGVVVGNVPVCCGVVDPRRIIFSIPYGVGCFSNVGNATHGDNGALPHLMVQNQGDLVGVGPRDGVGGTPALLVQFQ